MPSATVGRGIGLFVVALVAGCSGERRAETNAAASVVQVPLDPHGIPQFAEPLPMLDVADVRDGRPLTLRMCEIKARVLPRGAVESRHATETWAWSYIAGPACPKGGSARESYLGPVLIARRGQPTELTFINELGSTSTSKVRAYTSATDQTLHWADPLHDSANLCAHLSIMGHWPRRGCDRNYRGPIPTVPHLHGGQVPPVLDGGPDAWFTSDGSHHGPAYYTRPGGAAGANATVYRYPNGQEAAPLWFHDHTLGVTRLGVYAGLAGAYLLTDPAHPPPADLPGPEETIPLIVQDRIFDTAGQLLYPALPINPEHPFWSPELVGDTIVVNGKTWPYLEVQARRHRFVMVNGSNARTYELFLADETTGAAGPPIWQIGTDGGYLDAPVRIDEDDGDVRHLVLMPGERADLIIDFSGMAVGTRLVMRNVANMPFPDGEPPDESTLGRILELRVQASSGVDSSYDPASRAPLRTPMVRLADPERGAVASGVTVDTTRLLTLNEVMGMPTTARGIELPGGPLEVLLNNTRWSGLSPTEQHSAPMSVGTTALHVSEQPNEGGVELWELVNLTADAHPIHLHLAQFQLVSRQDLDVEAYQAAYAAAFPSGVYEPAAGPPRPYAAGPKLGGNPDVTPFLVDNHDRPAANEAGWKDTVMAPPGQVTRFVVRWAPTDLPVGAPASALRYPFDPAALGAGFVWHCHILEHEDNEMMRPLEVQPRPAVRSYVQGVDY